MLTGIFLLLAGVILVGVAINVAQSRELKRRAHEREHPVAPT